MQKKIKRNWVYYREKSMCTLHSAHTRMPIIIISLIRLEQRENAKKSHTINKYKYVVHKEYRQLIFFAPPVMRFRFFDCVVSANMLDYCRLLHSFTFLICFCFVLFLLPLLRCFFFASIFLSSFSLKRTLMSCLQCGMCAGCGGQKQ